MCVAPRPRPRRAQAGVAYPRRQPLRKRSAAHGARTPGAPVCHHVLVTDPCRECGFAYDLRQAATAGDDVRARVAEVVTILCDNTIDIRSRPRDGVWSPLEYGCHLRDVLLVQRERVLAARRTNGADCVSMGREERTVHDGYNEQEPGTVARQLADAALLFGNVLARLTTGGLGPRRRLPLPGDRRAVAALGRSAHRTRSPAPPARHPSPTMTGGCAHARAADPRKARRSRPLWRP